MAKKKSSSGSSKGFNFKEAMLLHLEKVLFVVIACLALGLIAMGFSVKPYASQKTPEVLGKDATQASIKLKENHWEEYSKALPEIKKDFPNAVELGRKKISSAPIYIYPPSELSTNRRGDPVILAPTDLRVNYYFGPLALGIAADKVKTTDRVFMLEDAKKPEERVRREPRSGRGTGGGGGSEPGKGSGGMGSGEGGSGGMGLGGMGPGGMGAGGMGAGGAGQGPRYLAPGYDRGFQMGMNTDPQAVGSTNSADSSKVAYSVAKGFVAVTALAPHAELEKNYKAELQEATDYLEGRDTPNYVGIEVQRVELEGQDSGRKIEEGEWKPLPKAGSEEYRRLVKALIGTCQEVQNPDWTEPNISMPIPPVLLNDFKQFASHPEIPLDVLEPNETVTELDDESETPGFAGGGLGSGSAGLGSGGMGRGGFAGMGRGGAPSAGGGSAGRGMGGGAPGTGIGGMGFDDDEGESGAGMGFGGRGLGAGGMGMPGQVPAELPKKLPSTKYKLVRFFDFDATPGKTYKYRVRLLMYDPNFPSVKAAQPKSNTLKAATLARVQSLIADESKKPDENAVKDASKGTTTPKRISKRETDWSASSEPVSIVSPERLFASDKTDCMVSEFDPSLSVYVPLASPAERGVERGFVFGTIRKERGKEIPFEIISPAGKIIKAYKDFKPKSMVTVVSTAGQNPLKAATARDPLKTGTEIVGFDPNSGQLLVGREFDDFGGYHMYQTPDSPAVGPLGGGLKFDSSGSGAGSGTGMGSGPGMGGPGMGGVGMGGAGMGSGPGRGFGGGGDGDEK